MFNDELIKQAAQELAQGGMVAFPTETVYGLGADAANIEAIRKVYALKGRPADHPSIVHLDSLDKLELWAREVPKAARKLAEHFWPGPMTLILPKRPEVLPQVTGGQDSVGIRIPAHPLTRELISVFAASAPNQTCTRRVWRSPQICIGRRTLCCGRRIYYRRLFERKTSNCTSRYAQCFSN